MRLLYTFMTSVAGVESWDVNEDLIWAGGGHPKNREVHI